jgi:steroid delta-isomerase-like uncharacterized protein
MNSQRITLIVFAGFVMLSSAQCQRRAERSVSTENNKTAVYRLVEEAWNRGNMAVANELLSPDYILHIPAREESVNREGYKQAISMYRTALSDFHLAIEEMIAENDRVVVRWTISGKHKGPYMGIAPTDKLVVLTGMSIRRIADGKIAEEWVVSDTLGLMQQMGAIPALGEGGR